jgi:CBS domain-containing protein
MKAKDIMTKEVVCVSPQTTVEEIAYLLLKHNISGVPVVDENEKIVGVVSEADLLYKKKLPTSLVYLYQHGSYLKPEELAEEDRKIRAIQAKEVMSGEVISVNPETPVGEVVSLMEREGVKRVLVMENGKLKGIVSKLDVLRCLSGKCGELPHDLKTRITVRPQQVKDVMSTEVYCIEKTATVEEAAQLLLEHRISGLPVVDKKGNLVGILSESDLIHKVEPLPHTTLYYRNRSKFLEEFWKSGAKQVSELMTKDVVTISPQDDLEKAATLMFDKGVKRLPVVERKRVVGMVTRADILKALVRNFLNS